MKRVLPVIVVSQFLCTSLWFAGNAILPHLVNSSALTPGLLAHLTSAVQFGFITGTLMFAVMTISDRFQPSRVFFCCSLLAAASNLAILMVSIQAESLLLFRFLTGFFLAGIYPVGMKIASDHYSKGLGRSLGFLVGALVLGTAFPHLLVRLTANFKWQYVLYSTSALSVLGGLGMILLVPDGPYRKRGKGLDLTAFLKVFKIKQFRAASIGYFGHMWELYSFWAFVPLMLGAYNHNYPGANINVPFMSFLIIASGGLACIFSGIMSERFGVKRIATIALCLSCMCCITSPFFLFNSSIFFFEAFLFFWGLVVIADSPLFSTLIAQAAPVESRGTSLTIVNCIGFSITIASIQLINSMSVSLGNNFTYLLLAIGPIAGIAALLKDDFSAAFKRRRIALAGSR
jgi:MFS family permease